MTSTATNIDDLPIGESNQDNSKPVQNVTFNIDESNNGNGQVNPSGVQQTNSSVVQLSQDDVNKIISGIQQASQSKLTALPSRDIPVHQTQHTMDEEALNPNYVPKKNIDDYIQNNTNYDAVLKQQYEEKQKQNKQDELIDELQTPIMISILFFIFQLPVVRKYLFLNFPNLFLKDGNIALSGIIVKSIAFGLIYYSLTKVIEYMSVV